MARELARLPRGNQVSVAETIQQHRLGRRQGARLVDHALKCRDARALGALLQNPWSRLVDQPPREPSRDARLGEVAEALRQRLLGLERAAGWWHESVQQHPLAALSSEELAVLGELAVTARERCAEALGRLDELFALAEVAS
jgi:hypothetical protein